MLLQHLISLGFNRSEVKLYLVLAEMGRASAAYLAKKTSIPRTTVYSILEKLIEKGVCSEEKSKRNTYFVINKPSSLLRVIEREKEALKQREEIAKQTIELISPYFRSKEFSIPKFQFFDGNVNVENMLYEWSREWDRCMLQNDCIWWGYQDKSFVDQYRAWLEWWWETRNNALRVQLFSNRSKTEEALKGKVPRRIIRPVPEEYQFASTIWVLGGEYIVLIMTQQKPHYAFQIKDSVFARNLQAIFSMLWKLTNQKD